MEVLGQRKEKEQKGEVNWRIRGLLSHFSDANTTSSEINASTQFSNFTLRLKEKKQCGDRFLSITTDCR